MAETRYSRLEGRELTELEEIDGKLCLDGRILSPDPELLTPTPVNFIFINRAGYPDYPIQLLEEPKAEEADAFTISKGIPSEESGGVYTYFAVNFYKLRKSH